MNWDARSNFNVKLFCAKHPDQPLFFAHEGSEIGADSAYEIHAKIMVQPCSSCKSEMHDIKWAIRKLLEVNGEILKKATE